MARGAALGRSGALQARARETAAQRGASIARQQQLQQGGRQLGRTRAEAFRVRREQRAKQLGHPSLEAYLRARYAEDGARLEDLQRELGAAYSAVRAELRQHGVMAARSWRAAR